MASGEKSYVMGRARRLFWPSAAVLFWMILWSVMSAALYPALLERIVIKDNTAFIMAGVQTFLYTAAWVVILAAYGLRSKVRLYRIMFLSLGGLYVLSAFGHFISNYYVSYILQFQGRFTDTMFIIAEAVSLLLQAGWIVFAVMAICHRRTGGVLRASAIVLIAARLADLAYRTFYGSLYQWLSLRYEAMVVSTLTWFMGAVMVFLEYAPVIFLLWALSFSRMKAIPEEREPEFPEV